MYKYETASNGTLSTILGDPIFEVRKRNVEISGIATCHVHCAPETPSSNPKTTYACGCSDYDQRPGTFESRE